MQNHRESPEIWFKPSPKASFDVLLELIVSKKLFISPRLGARDELHPKGYKRSQVATLRLFDDMGGEKVSLKIRIEDVKIKRLKRIEESDLVGSHFYGQSRDLEEDLSFFEGRDIMPEEDVSLINFSYL